MEPIEIRTENLQALKERMAKLDRRCARHNLPRVSWHVGETRFETVRLRSLDGRLICGINGEPLTTKIGYTAIHIEDCPPPAVSGFKFVAKIERTDGGNLVDTVPGVSISPRWRETDGRCAHCGTTRQRKEVFIVQDEATGEELQIGRNCLADFIGGHSPEMIVNMFRLISDLRGIGEDEELQRAFGGHSFSYPLVDLLAATHAAIRLWGWCSRTTARATQDNETPLDATINRVALLWSRIDEKDHEGKERKAQLLGALNDEDFAVAGKVIEWLRSIDDPKSDYMHNLKVLSASDYLTDAKRAGIVASAVPAYFKAQERELKRQEYVKEARKSEHVGKVGERVRGVPVTLIAKRALGDRGFGETFLYKMRGEDGALFCWFSTGGPDAINGRFLLDGTIKSHNEYQGVKETQMTRCKLKEIAQ